MDDLWSLDLQVLTCVVEHIERGDAPLRSTVVVEELNAANDEIFRSLRRLTDNGYIDATATLGGEYLIKRTTERGLRAASAWPDDAERLASKLIEALADAAENEPEPEKRGKIRAAAKSVAGMGKDVLTDVLATALMKSTGIG
jgi:hypothetical protein